MRCQPSLDAPKTQAAGTDCKKKSYYYLFIVVFFCLLIVVWYLKYDYSYYACDITTHILDKCQGVERKEK
jgi:hypothetical protein